MKLETWKVVGLLKPNNLDVLTSLLKEQYPDVISITQLRDFLLKHNKDANYWLDMVLECYDDCKQFTNQQAYYDAEKYVGTLRYALPEKNSIEDYEGYAGNPPSIYEFHRSIKLIEKLFNEFIYFFREQLSKTEIEDLKKYFYGGNSGIVNVGLYQSSREYGGAEEGGWYYTCWHHIETKEMPYDDAIKYIQKIKMENEDVYEHEGKEMAKIELYDAQHEIKGRQFYC